MWVRRELKTLGVPPLKRLGQHFLVDPEVRKNLIESAGLSRDDVVLEVGPGLGFLTMELADKAGKVIAVEKDRILAKHLQDRLSSRTNVEIVQGDALATPIPGNAKVVSSPPYNISSRLVFHIVRSHYKLAVLLLQNEFARRLTATSGSPDYGRLTVMTWNKARTELLKEIPKSSFYPQPKVNSAIIRMTATEQKVPLSDEELFEDMVRGLFTQRRRNLKGVLTRYIERRYPDTHGKILEQIPIPEKRVYETSPEELANLANTIASSANQIHAET